MAMNTVSQFVVGEQYTNDQIRYSLNLENMGGIRPSIGEDGRMQHLGLMTATASARKRKQENPYHDQIEGNVLCYTATGREGDQILTGKNKRLLEQYERPIPFYGFANEGRQIYRFLGLLELVRHYQEPQLDSQGKIRNTWIFEFLIHAQPNVVPISVGQEIAARVIAESRELREQVSEDRSVVIPASPSKEIERVEFVTLEQMRCSMLTVDPYQFEHLLKALVEKSGFADVAVTKSSGDGGIDLYGTVPDTDDFFAGTFVQFQAKRWRHAVGSVEINRFRGALNVSAKGVFCTTSHFTRAAIKEARHEMKPSITLIDGQRLSLVVMKVGLDLTPFLP